MKQLNLTEVGNLPSSVKTPTYSLSQVKAGIVHFGVGNFHRAHQAVYCESLLNEGNMEWGITGVSLRSATMRDNLAPQDWLYTLTEIGETTSYQVIGALRNVLVAPESPSKVIDVLSSNQTDLVTATITEKGYYLKNGGVDKSHPDITADLASLSAPKTIYGFIAASCINRAEHSGQPFTVLCCDNMQGSGEILKQGVELVLQHHNKEVIAWVKQNVAFSASMVDRVTPATNDELIQSVADELGVKDAAPVSTEPFTQWVIEDNFAGKKPPFDKAGALFVKDIHPYEKVKLRFLNSSHSMLALMGYLAGDDYVHEAISRKDMAEFANAALTKDVLPVTHVPADIDGLDYIEQVFKRFQNKYLPYRVLQVASDSSQKIQQRWFPAIEDAIKSDKSAPYMAFALASWVCFVLRAVQANVISDPQSDNLTKWVEALSTSDNPDISDLQNIKALLCVADAPKFSFFQDSDFLREVSTNVNAISVNGIEQALSQFLSLNGSK